MVWSGVPWSQCSAMLCTNFSQDSVSKWFSGWTITQLQTLLFKTYFSKYPNTWYQGDYAEVTKRDGFIVHGRSEATLNSGGVRIGTAEFYRVVEKIDNISECVAVEQRYKNDTRIILFIKLKKFFKLNTTLIELIKNKIKYSLSPKHTPSKIIQVSDIPKTKSGKIVELTIKQIIHNEKILNLSSLVNPESLNEFRDRKELED